MPHATLTPHFREFLPAWMASQEWFAGDGPPSLRMAGALRYEDPAGEVGMETHLLADGPTIYQVPMTFRGAPTEAALIATAEHSVLGTRWIYDATTDPVWLAVVLDVVCGNDTITDDRGPTRAVGRRLRADLTPDRLAVEVRRVLTADPVAPAPETAGLLLGDWPDVSGGCLAVVTDA